MQRLFTLRVSAPCRAHKREGRSVKAPLIRRIQKLVLLFQEISRFPIVGFVSKIAWCMFEHLDIDPHA